MQPLITRTVHASRAYSMIAVLGIAGALRLIVAELRYRRTLRRHFSDGAIMAMKFLQEHRNYTTGYDWVIRLNPDVIIRNTDWIETTMENANVDGIFADCYSSGCESHCAKGLIHTDLTIFRPRSLPFGVLDITNAERYATALFQTVVDRGRDRWIPQTTQYGVCRVNSPHVVHNHSILTDN